MNELGKFLEVVYGAGDGFRTVQAIIQKRRDAELAARADGGGRSAIGRRKAADTAEANSANSQSRVSIAIKLPHQFRIELLDGSDTTNEDALLVANEERWWTRNQNGIVESGLTRPSKDRPHRVPGLTTIERHFIRGSLREYFVALDLAQIGTLEYAGRPCVRIRAVPRSDGRLWPHWLPYGADEYELYGDLEHGTLLSIAGIFQSEVFSVLEVNQVAYDESIDDGLFQYVSDGQEAIRAAEPITEQLTLSAAMARVPFALYLPSQLPGGQHQGYQVMYQPPDRRSDRPHVTIMYMSDLRLWIDRSDERSKDLERLEFESFEACGKQMMISDPGEGLRVLTLQLNGTHITIYSDLHREELIRLASSMILASE